MIDIIIFCLWISLLPLSFTLILDTALGTPASENKVDVKAIFFPYSFFLAKLRLKKYNKYNEILEGFKEALNHKDVYVRDIANKAFKTAVFDQGKDFFTWEKGFGMCPVCTNIRISILFSLLAAGYLNYHWLTIIVIPCFSNLYLLIYNKLKN